jgi:surface polysaccharide O-acyltransferase-like enzyme
MKQFSVLLLALLGVIVVAAGTLDLLKEAQVLTLNFNLFRPVLVMVLGLWIVVCAVECTRDRKPEQ